MRFEPRLAGRGPVVRARDSADEACPDQACPDQACPDDVFAALEAGTAEAPCVVAQLGQSLDGRIALPSGESKYINGPAALDHLHALRARVDVVLVGVGTVVADDPMLTVRRVPGRSPARAVLDPNGRLPENPRCLAEDGARRVVLTRCPRPLPGGIETVVLEDAGPHCPRRIRAALGRLGFRRILVEGGARTISAFLDADCLDRLHLLVAPVILGSGRPGLDLAPIAGLDHALRPRVRSYPLPGGDVLFDCDLRRAAP
jgi:diaminohydroxyphosphoribosylaminopyrimidine deaminase / 5-amino-6-(5-phosphoribosylamino)uracil reductase